MIQRGKEKFAGYKGKLPDSNVKYGSLQAITHIGYQIYGNEIRYFYQWKCDCGNYINKPVKEVLQGKTKSCGCLSYRYNPLGNTDYRNPQLSTWKILYKRYKSSAKHRNIAFDITLETFTDICSKNCFYCGSSPIEKNKWDEPNVKRNGHKHTEDNYKKFTVLANGIDRIDSMLGYFDINIRPCCKDCNRAKMDLDEDKFFNLVKRVYERHCQ